MRKREGEREGERESYLGLLVVGLVVTHKMQLIFVHRNKADYLQLLTVVQAVQDTPLYAPVTQL